MASDANNQAGLQMKYFVLKPRGDDEFARASRSAMYQYARVIRPTNPLLAEQIVKWVADEGAEAYAKDGERGD